MAEVLTANGRNSGAEVYGIRAQDYAAIPAMTDGQGDQGDGVFLDHGVSWWVAFKRRQTGAFFFANNKLSSISLPAE